MEQNVYPRYRWFVLAAMLITTTAQAIILISPAPLVGAIAKTIGTNLGEATGAIYGGFNLIVGLTAILGGTLCDKFGIARVWITCSLLMIAGSLLVAVFGATVGGLALARCVQGAGAGPIMGSVSLVAAQWFPINERPYVTGTQGMCMGLGVALGFIISPALFEATGSWLMTLGWMAVCGVVGLVVSLIFVAGPKPPAVVCSLEDEKASGLTDNFKIALRMPVTWFCILCAFVLSWVFNGFNDMTPGYLAVGLNLGPVVAGKFMVAAQVAFIIGSLAVGVILDKIFRGRTKWVMIIGYLVAAVAIYCLKLPAIYSNPTNLLIDIGIAGFFMALPTPSVMAFIARYYPVAINGRIGGMAMGISIFGGTVGVGGGAFMLHATGTYLLTITLVAVMAVVGAILSLGMNPPKIFCNLMDSDKTRSIKM